MKVTTHPPNGISLEADTQDEIELLEAITVAIRDGGTVQVHGVTSLEFDGDPDYDEDEPSGK